MNQPTALITNNKSGIGQSADGIVTAAFERGAWGRVRLVDELGAPTGEPLPCKGCCAGGEVGQRVPLHRHSASSDWHLGLPGDWSQEIC